MADIELVIKIPEGLKNDFESEQWTALSCMEMKNALEKATLLPKGHGRLGDLDALRKEVSSWGMNDYEPSDFTDEIDKVDTIIEADREYEVKVIARGNCMICGKELTEGLFFCKECGAKSIQDRK